MNWIAFALGVITTFIFCSIWKARYHISSILEKARKSRELIQFTPATISLRDSQVLIRARELIYDNSIWVKNHEGHCVAGEKLTLYCALALAAKEIKGNFNVNEAYAQVVIFKITTLHGMRIELSNIKNRWATNILFLFNNHPETQHAEVLAIIDKALNHLVNEEDICLGKQC